MEQLWGSTGTELDPVQMAIRAVAMFFLLLVLVRVGGVRLFGKKSSFDNVVVILLGAVAARGVVGASPFGSTLAASTTLVVLHRVIAWLVVKYEPLRRLVEGERVCLYAEGQIVRPNLLRTTISEHELMESLRLETKQPELAHVHEAGLETNGRISFIEKRQ
jgi:uncharacterized membrane protein YcaP (DUF421 family)